MGSSHMLTPTPLHPHPARLPFKTQDTLLQRRKESETLKPPKPPMQRHK